MDKETFEALRIVIESAMKQNNNSGALDNAISMVANWMDEVEKEIDDFSSLGSQTRPSLRTAA